MLPPFLKTPKTIKQFLQQQPKQASKELKEIEKQSTKHCLLFLLQKLQLAHEKKNTDYVKAVRNIYGSEIHRYAFKKLRQL